MNAWIAGIETKTVLRIERDKNWSENIHTQKYNKITDREWNDDTESVFRYLQGNNILLHEIKLEKVQVFICKSIVNRILK